jgi:L-fuculose-phosphate aldolase
MLQLQKLGFGPATSGNTSVRHGEAFYIKPSGVRAEDIDPCHVPLINLDGRPAQGNGKKKPSTEWRFHREIYIARPDVGAIVHCHSNYATLLSCCGLDIPEDIHYHSAMLGGRVLCTQKFELPGSEELARSIVVGLGLRRGCLIRNHGQITVGKTMEEALDRAELLEQLAFFCWQLLNASRLHEPIPKEKLAQMGGILANYGQQPRAV